MRSSVFVFLAAGLVAAAAAGCSSDSAASDSGASDSGSAVAESGGVSPAGPVVDACALLTAADITPLIGENDGGKPTSTDPDAPSCVWTNSQSYESVTVMIGDTDTAINGTLPPLPDGITAEPGPDGMRFVGGGQVEFAAGKRNNSVQVARLGSADEVNGEAVALANKIAPQIPAG